MSNNVKAYLAEFFGTFCIVFFGTGAIILSQETGMVNHFGISLSFGVAVAVMIFCFAKYSGAHFNPAVTLALYVSKKFVLKQIVPYLCFQITGAIIASFILSKLFPHNQFLGATLPSGSAMESFLFEFFLTAALMLVILLIDYFSFSKLGWISLIIGFVIFLEAFFAGPICGASMNPARSLAPALISGHLEQVWIYLVATTLGAILTAIIFQMFRIRKSNAR